MLDPAKSNPATLGPPRRFLGAAMWPAILVTILTGMGFAGLKFVLIGEIALDFDHATHQPLMFDWMEQILQRSYAKHTLDEAITQGLAAVLTAGVLVGYLINAPLAGAWRVARLYVLSSAGVAAGTMLTLWYNQWLIAALVGIAYGTACAARGKVVPLLAAVSGRSNTQVSGFINASLVISLLAGTVFGTVLKGHVHDPGLRHGVLFAFLVVATLLSFLVNPPEPKPIPFKTGMRDLLTGTVALMRERWALLVAGGMAWGIASAAVLAAFMDAIDRLQMSPDKAVSLVIFPAVGAILGNLASHWMDRRRHVISSLIGLAAAIFFYPLLVQGPVTGAIFMVFIGALFAAPTNVLDARLLAHAAAQGQPGRGSTVMSLVHNVFILGIGSTLAIMLFLGHMTPDGQFDALAIIALLTGVVVLKAKLKDRSGDDSVPAAVASPRLEI
jgi:MFS family permease